MESVTVITLTRNRPQLLKRAIASVQAQVCSAEISHTILVDGCEATRSLLSALSLPPRVSWEYMPRLEEASSSLGRVAKLRNHAIHLAQTPWIAFLDDDNEWTEDHLATLLTCAANHKARAVHSYMCLFHGDGTPFLEQQHPWFPTLHLRFEEYKKLAVKGVYTPGSHIVRDRVDPLDIPDPVRSVDMGEWLLSRALLLETPLQESYTDLDETWMEGEDMKLTKDLVAKREPIACTHRPTLKYYLGGFSNRPRPEG